MKKPVTPIAKYLKERAVRFIAAGLCRDCGKNLAAEHKTLCVECLIYRRIRERERYRNGRDSRTVILPASAVKPW